MLTAPINLTRGLSSFLARSEFNTESGAITGDSLAVGGTWTWSGTGDTDDFSVSGGAATRTAVSDSGSPGRLLVASGSSAAAQTVQVDLKATALAASTIGVIARYVDASNFVWAYVNFDNSPHPNRSVVLQKVIGGAGTTLGYYPLPAVPSVSTYYTIACQILANGSWALWFFPQASALPPAPVRVGIDSALATGGTLASGKAGIADWWATSTASTRTYDNFAAWAPISDAVSFSGQSVQLTTQGHLREDSGGTAYGPVSVPDGSLPRFPVPAQSGGTVEVLMIPTNGDFDQLPDTMGTASISARATRRPSWLFVSND